MNTRVHTLALGLLTLLLPAGSAHATLGPATLAPASTARLSVAWMADSALDDVDAALVAWDLPAARAALARAADSPETRVKQGVLAVYEADYAGAESTLAAVLAAGTLREGSAALEEAEHYLGLARGAQKALDQAITRRSDDGHFEAVFASEKDALIAPYLFESMELARERIGAIIGVVPEHTVRFEFLDQATKLALVTPLTVENIRTTGTVGVTKYRRVMMITPRVMVYGYGWIDTAVHEYVHYVLTMRTDNLAPVWLQEGLAKLLETRWRRTEPETLDPKIAYRLHRAIVDDDLVTLSEMYPSVAMLPSAERAALAYAEVETMLGLLHERKGNEGVARLLDRVAAGDDAEAALAHAWGDSFEAFMSEWKRVTQARTAGGEDGELSMPEFKDGTTPPEQLGDVFSALGGGRARQHARLGALLQARGHHEAAAAQYEKARAADKRARKDPTLAKRLGKLYVTLERYAEAAPLLDIAAALAPEDANLAAAQGRAHLRSGDHDGAREALGRAVRNNPFIPTLHCDLAPLAPNEARRAAEQALCDSKG
jgi:tetratricopeptide (TPR) repeat protein